MSSENKVDSVSTEVMDALNEKVSGLVSALSLDVTLEDGKDHEGTAYFNLTGADTGYFLNNKAEPVKSMAFLLQSWHDHVYGETGVNVKVDADGELHKREQELQAMAKEAIEAIDESGGEFKIDPLNPYDRRVVHMILNRKGGYVSESVGHGHFKSMIIRKG